MAAVGAPLALAALALVLAPVAAALPLAWLGPDAGGALRVARRVGGVALVAAALLVMLPEALEGASVGAVALGFAAGAVAFLGLARVTHALAGRAGREVAAILGASALHKLIDGTLLGIAAALGPQAVTATLIALVLHELPHEIGTYALLLSSGVGRGRALAWKVLAGLGALPGVALGVGAGAIAGDAVHVLLALSAGAFALVGGVAVFGPAHGGARRG